jgi:hypothetical protein
MNDPAAVFVFLKVIFKNLFFKFFLYLFVIKKLVNEKYFLVKRKFILISRKVFSCKI